MSREMPERIQLFFQDAVDNIRHAKTQDFCRPICRPISQGICMGGP